MAQIGKKKVLVIDDSLMVRKLLVAQLSNDRFEVYEGKDGATGLAVASQIKPDVILLDFVMPGMNGYEVYQALREQPQLAKTPVIVFSSSYEEVVKKFGYPFVGFEFLHKQATSEQILEKINGLLGAPAIDKTTIQQASEDTRIQTTISTSDTAVTALLPEEDSVTMPGRPDFTMPGRKPAPAAELASQPTPLPPDRTGELLERLTALEKRLDTSLVETIRTTIEKTPMTSKATTEILQRLERLASTTAPPPSLDPVLQRLDHLEKKLNNSSTSGKLTPSFWMWMILAAAIAATIGGLIGASIQSQKPQRTSEAPSAPMLSAKVSQRSSR
jgi:twitching motility two-component system response regulator PilH